MCVCVVCRQCNNLHYSLVVPHVLDTILIWYLLSVHIYHCHFAAHHALPPAGNTRVITQTALQSFQEEMGKAMKDPYKVTLSV